MSEKEILLYLFLILASDKNGLSFYSRDSICSLLKFSSEQYTRALNGLLNKDLIEFDGTVFQVLELPKSSPPLISASLFDVRQLAKRLVKEM